jgi:integrase
MRFSEVTGLTWGCVDLVKGRIDILNAKGEKDRSLPMTARVKELFGGMTSGAPNELMFKSRVGGQIGKIPKSFDFAMEKLGLNKDMDAPKQIFSFHCLRHTCASWLIEAMIEARTQANMTQADVAKRLGEALGVGPDQGLQAVSGCRPPRSPTG